MSHFKRTILLVFIMTITTLLCVGGGRSAAPIKVSLTTTAIPADTIYYLPSFLLGGKLSPAGWFCMIQENPTTKLTLGGIEYIVKAQTPPIQAIYEDYGSVPGKLLITTPPPTQEFTFNLPSNFSELRETQPLELMLNNGRKYFLTAMGEANVSTDFRTGKKQIITEGAFEPGGVQTGKIGPSPQSIIALYDSNVDGFYSIDEDGIVIGSPVEKVHIVQPLSKYISTSGGIFEIQNLAKDGSELTLLPYRGPTATLEVVAPQDYSGQIILTSTDANHNVTVSGKAEERVAVVPGSYTILAAMLDSPSRGPSMLVSGAGMSALKVETGAKQILALSGPKVLEFQATLLNGNVAIKLYGNTFRIKGHAGETYSSIRYDPKNLPKVYLNVDGKSTLLVGKMEFG